MLTSNTTRTLFVRFDHFNQRLLGYLKPSFLLAAYMSIFCIPDVFAADMQGELGQEGNNAFKGFYDFVMGAATGTLGKGIALTGGLIGLGFGAASGRALPAIVGVVLAMFGAIGPKIITSLFGSALI